jgi:2,3-bisphosphoglycerate-independent phosphoglycerate mutase
MDLKPLLVKNDERILLVVADGLGGLPKDDRTELEAAQTPNLDRLAAQSSLGLTEPVAPGITPGSGPAHLALFGYDPLSHEVGRGVLEALGVGLVLTPEDLCIRANFASIKDGVIVDRRAGRIPTEENRRLCSRLQEEISDIEGVKIIIKPSKEHRFVVVFKGYGLSDRLPDTDPQHEGAPPVAVEPLAPEAERSARVTREFLNRATDLLKAETQANYILLRGFSHYPSFEPISERYGLKAACIASYPMYRGIARLVGMEVLETGNSWDDELETLSQTQDQFDFFYLHFKETDMRGEDGDFAGKVRLIEALDQRLPQILALNFSVLAITSDHSTPALLRAHSWHPNPFLLHSRYCRVEGVEGFSERRCQQGVLGQFPATQVMPLLLAHARRLKKYGA